MRTLRNYLQARFTNWLSETAALTAFAAMLAMLMCGVRQPWPYDVAAAVYYTALTFRCGVGITAYARRPTK